MLSELKYTVVGVAKNYAQALQRIAEADRIDLVMLDINLNETKDGIDLAAKLNELGLPHIYLTSYSNPETVKRAATTSPAGYLLKPFTQADLYTTIELLRARTYDSQGSILLKEGRDAVRISTQDIVYVKSDNNYLEVLTEKKTHIIRHSMESFLEEVEDPNLVRTHRSFAVNIMKVEAIRGSELYMGKYKCPISRSYRQEFLDSIKARN